MRCTSRPHRPPLVVPRPTSSILLALALAFVAFVARPTGAQGDTPAPVGLTTEYRALPLGIDARAPRFSWKNASEARDWHQSAYQIVVSSTLGEAADGRADVWTSGKVLSDRSVGIVYEGPPLESGRRYYWSVRVWDVDDDESPWAAAHWWEMGLLEPGDWQADWITRPEGASADEDDGAGWAPLFRRAFTVSSPVRSARLYATAVGRYRVFLNGRRVGDATPAPTLTDALRRITYQTYDVTDLITSGENAVGAILDPAPLLFRAQLAIAYADGTTETIGTGPDWVTAEAPIRVAVDGGEIYDAQREQDDWNAGGFAAEGWQPAVVVPEPEGTLVAQATDPIRVVDEIQPRSVQAQPGGVYIFDLGQRMTGTITLRVSGEAGQRVRLRFAQQLGPGGAIWRDPQADPGGEDVYVLRGARVEAYAPVFAVHDFRYVEIRGYPGLPPLAALTGQVLSNVDGEPSGHLETSNDVVNRIREEGVRAHRRQFARMSAGNRAGSPVPPFAGAGFFWRAGTYDFDVAAFTSDWLQTMGDVPPPDTADAAPSVAAVHAPSGGDAVVLVPWAAWMQYGDRAYIDRNWEVMERWMADIHAANPDLIRRGSAAHGVADWLAPDARTSPDLVATACWALMAGRMAEMARATDRADAAAQYAALHDAIRAAYQRAFLLDDGRIDPGTQTAYALTLGLRLAPEALVPRVLAHLVDAIAARDGHPSTGLIGTPFLLSALADNGRVDLAYDLLLTDTYPSWGYAARGETALALERPGGGAGTDPMAAYTHDAFGSVAEWLYRYVGGIDTDASAPGFRHVVVRPRPDLRVSHAAAEYESINGRIATDWTGTATGPFELNVTIPANTTATVYLPAVPNASVTEQGRPMPHVVEDGSYVVRIGSGHYSFVVR